MSSVTDVKLPSRLTPPAAKPQLTYEEELKRAFPDVDPGIEPYGSRILVQIRAPKTHSNGGIELHPETVKTELDNTQVAKLIRVGPLAFKNRGTLESWPEGDWCQPGDYVRVPKYGGDRWEIGQMGKDGWSVFALFDDLNVLGKVVGDPLRIKAFI